MSNPWHRPVLAALAAALLLAGIVTVSIGRGGTSANAAGTVTIEILDSGFNPQVCQVNRNNSTVLWKNKSTKVRRVIVKGAIEPIYDSGDLQPGETGLGGVYITSLATYQVSDFYEPTMTGQVVSPMSPSAQTVCSPLPPTPTPTPTRTPTPIPTPTPIAPTPAPLQLHPRCIGLQGCAIAPIIASDE